MVKKIMEEVPDEPKYVTFTLAPQDAGLLVDLVGLCKTPWALLTYGKFTEQFVPQVSMFIQKFNKEANIFTEESKAIYDNYFEKDWDGEDKKSKLKNGKTMEDFNNTLAGSKNDFQARVEVLKSERTSYTVDIFEFWNFFEALKDKIDLSMPSPAKEKDWEIFTAQLYSVMKELDEVKF